VEWLKWYRACLTSVRPWVQTPVQKKKKKWREDSLSSYPRPSLATSQHQWERD
jgi:hypothetical protein